MIDKVHANREKDALHRHSFQKTVAVIDPPEEWKKWVYDGNEYEYSEEDN